MTTDPRQALDLQAAAQNRDGSYSLPRAMSWLSEVLNPGQGVPEARVRELIDEAMRKRDLARRAAHTQARTGATPPEPEAPPSAAP